MRVINILMVVLTALWLGSCSKVEPTVQVATTSSIPYTLDNGDRLRIEVFGQRNMSNTYVVDGNGTISMPLIGPVQVRGLTTAQTEIKLESRLGSQYLRNPNVTVEVQRHRPFFVLGEVTRSGQYAFVSGMTAQTAIAIAGGFTPRGDRKLVRVTRKWEGKIVQFDAPLTYQVLPGDTIFVRERYF
ncbi:MAG TPA: polysaccharide export protein [Rhizobiales bacterium]|nr:polysaccharide export protein [Hyphomicrobiales bacterium]